MTDGAGRMQWMATWWLAAIVGFTAPARPEAADPNASERRQGTESAQRPEEPDYRAFFLAQVERFRKETMDPPRSYEVDYRRDCALASQLAYAFRLTGDSGYANAALPVLRGFVRDINRGHFPPGYFPSHATASILLHLQEGGFQFESRGEAPLLTRKQKELRDGGPVSPENVRLPGEQEEEEKVEETEAEIKVDGLVSAESEKRKHKDRVVRVPDFFDGPRFVQDARTAFLRAFPPQFTEVPLVEGLVGTSAVARLFPEEDRAKGYAREARRELDAFLSRGEAARGNNRNIGVLWSILCAAEWLGYRERLEREDVRQVLEYCRALQPPSGQIPDWVFGPSRPLDWVPVFEMAARLYRDPSFRGSAVLAFRNGGMPSDRFPYAAEWRDSSLGIQFPEGGAGIVPQLPEAAATRGSPPAAPDKLVLGPAREPGAPFVAAELTAPHQRISAFPAGAVLWYEVDGTRFRKADRAAGQPFLSNVVTLSRNSPDSVLLNQDALPIGEWQEAVIPIAALPAVSGLPEHGHLRKGNEVSLQWYHDTPEPVFATFDHFRLEGPKGVLLLQDFEGPDRGNSMDAIQGRYALRVRWDSPARSGLWRMPFRLPGILDLREYEALKYAWKLSPNFKPHPERAIEVAGLGGSPLHAGFSFAQLERAKATRQGGDGFGEMIWRCYFTQDSRLTRRMVLLAEGPLLVVDILEPGEDADGYTAGPSWALPPGASAEPHGRGFLEAGFERTPPGDAAVRQSLLSLFGTRDGQKAVLQAARGTCRIAVQQTLKARQTATFVSLMIPCRGAASATTMADNVTINSTQDGAASVSLRTETAAVEITVQTDGTWNVQRRVRQTD